MLQVTQVIFFFFVFDILFAWPADLPAECVYTIHPDQGDDDKSCRVGDPCRTFARLAQTVERAFTPTTLCVQAGYYYESTRGCWW